MALNSKKRAFADAVLAGKSNRDAAIAAGYSAATASQAGSRLVKDKDVTLYIAARKVEGEKKGSRDSDSDKTGRGHRPPDDFDPYSVTNFTDPKAFLIAAMNDGRTEPKLRVDAAKALMPFMHPKLGEGGKKDAKAEAAKKAANRFGALAPPLKLVGGK
ncbi:terminase small subunit [Burkholderia gladioli]|uniref:terminase small subunit n=1 Tax=Burkholderia gladioli TaxID=28095 RepID=UPI001640EE9E|nr:terminase small subunit [Burkholderia gladioli]